MISSFKFGQISGISTPMHVTKDLNIETGLTVLSKVNRALCARGLWELETAGT